MSMSVLDDAVAELAATLPARSGDECDFDDDTIRLVEILQTDALLITARFMCRGCRGDDKRFFRLPSPSSTVWVHDSLPGRGGAYVCTASPLYTLLRAAGRMPYWQSDRAIEAAMAYSGRDTIEFLLRELAAMDLFQVCRTANGIDVKTANQRVVVAVLQYLKPFHDQQPEGAYRYLLSRAERAFGDDADDLLEGLR